MSALRLYLTVIILLAFTTIVRAVPANPTPIKVKQPDGNSITIVLRGDEWLSFTTTTDGYTVVKNDEGYYVYALLEDGQLKPSQVVVHDADERQGEERSYLENIPKYLTPEMSSETIQLKKETNQRRKARRNANRRHAKYAYEHFKGLAILVEFNDMKFSREDYKALFTDMMNKKDYTGYDNEQFTGSVRDYFYDNSNGKFDPQFDVVGPYTIDFSQYDGRTYSNRIMKAAIDSADVDVNFKDYDLDNDGEMEGIYFLFAGYAANYSGNDERLLWPHESYLYDYSNNGVQPIVRDDVRIMTYSCSTEMYGWTNNPSSLKINGIGTICHEFSHALGLPDFYDTTYSHDKHPGHWSVMANGIGNNYGRTPVGYSLYERWALGFCDEPEILSTVGDYTLPPLYQDQQGYRLNTPNTDEFFLLENRQKNTFKWDKYLPGSGMLVFRVDRSDLKPWNNNTVNNDSTHLCYELIRANGGTGSSSSDAFPASGKYLQTTLTNYTSPAHLKTWDGKDNDYGIINIQMNDGIITFRLTDYTETAIPSIKKESEDKGKSVVHYNLYGQRVSDSYKGVVIMDGKKILRK